MILIAKTKKLHACSKFVAMTTSIIKIKDMFVQD